MQLHMGRHKPPWTRLQTNVLLRALIDLKKLLFIEVSRMLNVDVYNLNVKKTKQTKFTLRETAHLYCTQRFITLNI